MSDPDLYSADPWIREAARARQAGQQQQTVRPPPAQKKQPTKIYGFSIMEEYNKAGEEQIRKAENNYKDEPDPEIREVKRAASGIGSLIGLGLLAVTALLDSCDNDEIRSQSPEIRSNVVLTNSTLKNINHYTPS